MPDPSAWWLTDEDRARTEQVMKAEETPEEDTPPTQPGTEGLTFHLGPTAEEQVEQLTHDNKKDELVKLAEQTPGATTTGTKEEIAASIVEAGGTIPADVSTQQGVQDAQVAASDPSIATATESRSSRTART